jgi:hypothetical protein
VDDKTHNSQEVKMNTFNNTGRRWSTMVRTGTTLLGILVVGLFVASAHYSTDPRALTPVGVIVFLAILAVGARLMIRLVRHARPALWRWAAVAAVLASLVVTRPIEAASLPTVPFWQVVNYTAPALVNPWAWRATLDIQPQLGLRGIAPVFYRPLTPWTPVTVFATPNGTSSSLRTIAVATPRQVVPITASPALGHSLPPNSVQVQKVIILAGTQPGTLATPTFFNPALLQANCSTCWRETRLEINSAFVGKMTLEGVKFTVSMALPIPKTAGLLNLGDLVDFANIADTYTSQAPGAGPQLAQAQLNSWFTAKAAGLGTRAFLKVYNPWQDEISPLPDLVEFTTHQALAPRAPSDPTWSWRTTEWSGGTTSVGGTQYTWTTRLTETYQGTFLNEGWTSYRTTRVIQNTEPTFNPSTITRPPTYNPSFSSNQPVCSPFICP